MTQRTIGPVCTGTVLVDVSNLKDGDFAELGLLQKKYGQIGVRVEGGNRSVVMINASTGTPVEAQSVPLKQSVVYLKAECDFKDRKDTAYFYYSLDGKSWLPLGTPLKMAYTIPQFIGYRFALFNYATRTTGGWADFDLFHISDAISADHRQTDK